MRNELPVIDNLTYERQKANFIIMADSFLIRRCIK
jgi:hypothetical protein